MEESPKDPLEELLTRWAAGDASAGEQFLVLAYAEMRRIAAFHFRRENPGHTLQPTALVHDVFMKLLGGRNVRWKNPAHFYAAFSLMVRMSLVDHSRRKTAGKRQKPQPARGEQQSGPRYESMLTLHEILVDLEKDHPRAVQVAELRVLWGMKDPEIAEALGIAVATVKRDWTYARARLSERLRK